VSVPRFGEYTHSELSLCMAKDLQQSAQIPGSGEGQLNLARD
jgi:hypothetical protein